MTRGGVKNCFQDLPACFKFFKFLSALLHSHIKGRPLFRLLFELPLGWLKLGGTFFTFPFPLLCFRIKGRPIFIFITSSAQHHLAIFDPAFFDPHLCLPTAPCKLSKERPHPRGHSNAMQAAERTESRNDTKVMKPSPTARKAREPRCDTTRI